MGDFVRKRGPEETDLSIFMLFDKEEAVMEECDTSKSLSVANWGRLNKYCLFLGDKDALSSTCRDGISQVKVLTPVPEKQGQKV